jgi:hypothetical protein
VEEAVKVNAMPAQSKFSRKSRNLMLSLLKEIGDQREEYVRKTLEKARALSSGRTTTDQDLDALTRSYKPLPPDHPLRGKVFFMPVPKRGTSK